MPERGRGYKTTPASSILCLSQMRVEADVPWRNAFLHASCLSSSIAFFWYFPSRFSHSRRQSFPMTILWEKLWQRGRTNTIGLKEWYRQKNIDFKSYLLVKLQSLLKFSTIFKKKMHQSSNWEIPTTKNILDLSLLLCQISFYIFQR